VEAFRDLINRRAADIIMLDLGFTGGLSEGRRIGNMAEAAQLPITAHDCTGPVVFAASVHLSMHLPNALIQEAVRAFYTGWYTEIVTQLPHIDHGMVSPPDGPGLGMELRPEVFKRADLRQRVSNWEG
jgi:L-alanine-DL-glutamate epimerase-like enolase superfamily enzyme